VAKTTLKKPSATKSRASSASTSGKSKSAGKRAVMLVKASANTRTAVKPSAKKTSTKDKAANAKSNRPGSGKPISSGRGSNATSTVSSPPVGSVATTLDFAGGDNGKKRKNAAGFSQRELDNFRELLLAKRREILGDLRSMEHEALRASGGSNLSNLPIHMADMGTDNYEQEFTLGLVEKDRQMLREINAALLKIQSGNYGICEGTGKPIGKERLEYQPWARFSIEYARKMERMGRPGVL
jgi:DnaK suppressor protein